MSTLKSDVVIIGGGIVGTAIARELAKYQLRVVLLEKEPELAAGTTKANSAILHAGFDAKPGTLKARLNVRGNALYHALREELSLAIQWIGSLVVATDKEELQTIAELLNRGNQNQVPGLALLSREEALTREPGLVNAEGALWAPSTGIFLPFDAALAFAENAAQNGVQILTECPVTNMEITNGRITGVRTPQGSITASYVINAAGLYADTVARLAGDTSFTLTPRKGEYILFDKNAGPRVNHVLFPTPTKHSKGILVAPTVHGNTFIGPNAQNMPEEENLAIAAKENLATTAAGFQEVITGAKRLFPAIPLNASITEFSGLRAVADSDDFVIRPSTVVNGLIHAAGIQSPGLTAAPAIAELVAELLKECGLLLLPKKKFISHNEPKIVFRELSNEQKQTLIRKNPLYGRVICRCETVTEAEIVAAIHSPCGAKTVDGVKRRTRAGMGRCQGGFCGPKVAAILARELQVPLTAIRKETAQSYLFYDKIPVDAGGNQSETIR